MQLIYFDLDDKIDATTNTQVKNLLQYRSYVAEVIEDGDETKPETSLAMWQDEDLFTEAERVAKQFKKAKHVIVVGIGGSSLGVEAIDAALRTPETKRLLHVLDAVSSHAMATLMDSLAKVKKASDVVVCVVSKSGATTETLSNAAVLQQQLKKQLGADVKKQFVYIGDVGNELLQTGKKQGGTTVVIPKAIGGRYSVFTAVGIVPLALLGHDIKALRQGSEDASLERYENATAESAARLVAYMKRGMRTVNFFGFDVRLQKLGFWYRQLFAESIGKAETRDGKPNTLGLLPVVTTPVELHSIGQLYFSGFAGVYTDMLSFEDADYEYNIQKHATLAKPLQGKSLNDISAAIYGGVVGAYQERELPYRSTTFDEELAYSLGLFMTMRMRETMYVAELLNLNAFNQPNVELYKDKTHAILGS